MPKPPNYAEIAARDRLALQLAQETGCGFVEAWLRVIDGQVPGDPEGTGPRAVSCQSSAGRPGARR